MTNRRPFSSSQRRLKEARIKKQEKRKNTISRRKPFYLVLTDWLTRDKNTIAVSIYLLSASSTFIQYSGGDTAQKVTRIFNKKKIPENRRTKHNVCLPTVIFFFFIRFPKTLYMLSDFVRNPKVLCAEKNTKPRRSILDMGYEFVILQSGS